MHTHTPPVLDNVRFILQLLRAKHPNTCQTCDADGNCTFQNLLYRFQVRIINSPSTYYPFISPFLPSTYSHFIHPSIHLSCLAFHSTHPPSHPPTHPPLSRSRTLLLPRSASLSSTTTNGMVVGGGLESPLTANPPLLLFPFPRKERVGGWSRLMMRFISMRISVSSAGAAWPCAPRCKGWVRRWVGGWVGWEELLSLCLSVSVSLISHLTHPPTHLFLHRPDRVCGQGGERTHLHYPRLTFIRDQMH